MTKETATTPNDDPEPSSGQSDPSSCFVLSSSVSHAYDAHVHAYDEGARLCPYVCVDARPCRWCPYVHNTHLRPRGARYAPERP